MIDLTSVLPEETLCLIFTFVQSIDPLRWSKIHRLQPDRYTVETRSYCKSGWINVTYVNRRWRRIATEYPLLWTRITGDLGTLWVNEFILRSQNAPLSIDNYQYSNYNLQPTFELDGESDILLRDVLVNHHARVSAFTLHVPTIAFLKNILACSFQLLVEVVLEEREMGDSWESHEYDPVHMLLDHAPHLRRLHLTLFNYWHNPLHWKHRALNNLTSLHMVMKGTLPFPECADALRRMRLLTELCVQVYEERDTLIDCVDCRTGLTKEAIYLNGMRSFKLYASTEAHAHMLRHIQLPPVVRVMLLSRRPSKDKPVNEALSRELAASLRIRQRGSPFQSAHLIVKARARFEPLSVVVGLQRAARSNSPQFSADLIDNRRPHGYDHAYDLIVQLAPEMALVVSPSFPTSSVHTLSLLDVCSPFETVVLPPLVLFPNVERLRLGISSCGLRYGGARLIQHRFLEDHTLLPMLRLVDLDKTTFKLETVLKLVQSESEPAQHDSPLESVLQARARAGHPIQAVYLHVEEEVSLVKQWRTNETSCKGMDQRNLLRSINRMEAVNGLCIVREDQDPFASWPSPGP